MLKNRFLLILSTKSHFQTLLEHINESRSEGKQEIQGLWCIDRSITRKTQEYKWAHLGVIVGFAISSLINGSDEMLGCESLWLSRVRSIEDKSERFPHVTSEEVTPENARHMILI